MQRMMSVAKKGKIEEENRTQNILYLFYYFWWERSEDIETYSEEHIERKRLVE